MTSPLPPEITYQTGRKGYLNPYTGKYSRSRSYALRMQRNYARGMSQSEARGHRAVGGVTEAQRRREQAAAVNPSLSRSQQFALGFQQRYGFTYNYWRYLKRNYIDAINSRSSPDMQITPIWIQQIIVNTPMTGLGTDWIETRLAERLNDMIAYQDYDDRDPGGAHFAERIAYTPIEWWYYH